MQLATFKYNNNNDKSSTVFEWWIHDDDDIITLIVFQGVFSRGGDGICHYKIIFDTFFIFFQRHREPLSTLKLVMPTLLYDGVCEHTCIRFWARKTSA